MQNDLNKILDIKSIREDLKSLLLAVEKKEITVRQNSRLIRFERLLQPRDERFFQVFIFTLVHYDEWQILRFFLKKYSNLFLDQLKKMNSREYNSEWENQDMLSHAVSRNAVSTLKVFRPAGWHTSEEHLLVAIDSQAKDSVKYLLETHAISYRKKLELAKRARMLGSLAMIHLLVPQEPLFYFSETIQEISHSLSATLQQASTAFRLKKDVIFLQTSNAYLNSSVAMVEKLCANFLQGLQDLFPQKACLNIINDIKIEIQHAQEGSKQWLPQVARYSFTGSRQELKSIYGASSHDIKKEIEYGTDKFKLVKQLCEDKVNSKNFKNLLKLPPCKPPKNFYSMRHLLEIMMAARMKAACIRDDTNENVFGMRRSGQSLGTPCAVNRYDYMCSFIDAMAAFPGDKYMSILSTKEGDDFDGYELYYKGEAFSQVIVTKLGWRWMHGQIVNIDKYWPDVERIHRKLFDLDLKQILQNTQAFYADVAELLWLMGNLQIFPRGTGFYVEQWFAICHWRNGLEIPKLKIGQLDCYNITFKLPIYLKIFLYLFDPRTLHPTVLGSMQKQYQTDPETRNLVRIFNLTPICSATSFRRYSILGQTKKSNSKSGTVVASQAQEPPAAPICCLII